MPEPQGEPTDPGFKQNNTKIGANSEFTLPDVTPIISPHHTSRVGIVANEVWVRTNWLMRGLAGTAVDWFTFFAEVGSAYPKISAILLGLSSVTIEEKYNDNPIITNCIRYGMETFDPAAAAKIFDPKIYPPDPIGDASRKLLADATRAYLDSTEYQALKVDVEQDVQRQIRRQTYAAAGMKDDVAAVDAEIAAAAAARVAKRASTPVATSTGTLDPVETPASLSASSPPTLQPILTDPHSTAEPIPTPASESALPLQ